MEYVFHAVTERPMLPGQKILFDGEHHNGVYNRVAVFQKLMGGEEVCGRDADLINADMDRWAKVARRELALEQVRREQFPDYPSRMACLYTSRTLEEARSWAQFFNEIGRDVYSIVKLRVCGRVFDGDACNCFDGTENEEENLEKAKHYWNRDVEHERPVIETLADGIILVEEVIERFKD